uniref:Uncharacterized protein n=1 Tax=Peronospora matthiolae TaxID=2874970 RepID=A0AAV1UKB5_9STRA
MDTVGNDDYDKVVNDQRLHETRSTPVDLACSEEEASLDKRVLQTLFDLSTHRTLAVTYLLEPPITKLDFVASSRSSTGQERL